MIQHLPHPPSTVNQLKAAVCKVNNSAQIETLRDLTGHKVLHTPGKTAEPMK
jgi:methionine aminopeptidase